MNNLFNKLILKEYVMLILTKIFNVKKRRNNHANLNNMGFYFMQGVIHFQ